MRLLPYLRLAAGPWIVFFRYVLYFVQFIPYPHIFFTAISRLQAQDSSQTGERRIRKGLVQQSA